jgi:NAD(P)-dependent dehydrogenase (short-subunit alcohol dehydrogenase family)
MPYLSPRATATPSGPARPGARRGAGRIVNIVSIGGRVAMPHMLAYDASKFALMGFSEALQADLGSSQARVPVTTVIPGPMRTGSFYNAEFGGQQQAEFGWFALLSSLPVTSIDARRAARRIVRAAREGAPWVHLGVSSWSLDLLHRLSPSLAVRAMTLMGMLLPRSAGYRGELAKGRDVGQALAGSPALHLGDVAAHRHNEAPPPDAAR